MRIHFVCRGNAYRSRLAEAYFRSLGTGIDVISSGTVADLYRKYNDPITLVFTDRFLRNHGVNEVLKQHPDQLTLDRIKHDDIVICMNQIVADEFSKIAPLPENTTVWDITDFGEPKSDPTAARLSKEAYTELIYKQLTDSINGVVLLLTSK